jgi:hypothetical protein
MADDGNASLTPTAQTLSPRRPASRADLEAIIDKIEVLYRQHSLGKVRQKLLESEGLVAR